MPPVQKLPFGQDQPLHRDPRDAGQGTDARRHDAFQLQGPADLSLYGLFDLLELHSAARDRGGETPRGRADAVELLRSEEHRVGKAWDRTGRSGWSPVTEKKK